MKIWDLYCYNLWIDIKGFGKKFQKKWKWFNEKLQKKWKLFKQNYYGWITKRIQKKQNKYKIKLLKVHTKFYECDGEYMSAKINNGFHERIDIKFKISDVVI